MTAAFALLADGLGLLGIGADAEVEASAADLKEYAVVLVRLMDDDKVALCPSSSESGSGAARFFPLRSFVGSVIAMGRADAEGSVTRRALLLSLIVSSDVSFGFPLPELPSGKRLFLVLVVDLVARALSAGRTKDCSAESPSLSFACSRSFSFCLAAFTLALERVGFGSVVDADADDDEKMACCDSGGCKGTLASC